MTRPIPDEIQAMARARGEAREAQDWAEADRLRGRIERAGWTVVDRGRHTTVTPTHPPDVSDGTRERFGTSASVPSRLGHPATATATVVLLAMDDPVALGRALGGLRAGAPRDTQVIVVANCPSEEGLAELEPSETGNHLLAAIAGEPPELLWTSTRLPVVAALACGVRRALGSTVILLDTDLEPLGDLVTPLVRSLADKDVAVSGTSGADTPDLSHFSAAGPGDVDVVEADCLAFRRDDLASRGPFDERFAFRRDFARWWSLVLRDGGMDAAPRRALALDLPVVRHAPATLPWHAAPDGERLAKRDRYRVINRFAGRRDLLRAPAPRRSEGARTS